MKTFIVILFTSLVAPLLAGCSMESQRKLELDGEWLFKKDSSDQGITDGWFTTGIDRSSWERHVLPGFWDRYSDLAKYDGAGWYYKTFVIEDTATAWSIVFAGVDDDADVWVNGVSIGSHAGYSDAFSCSLSGVLRKGENVVVVRVFDASGPGGIYKPVSVVATAEVEAAIRTPFAEKDARKSEDWVRDAVIYEVYLRSFSKEGTFRALESRLSELKDLGVTVLWLMPIHPVGELNRKGTLGSPYSIRDYYGINPEFGTLEDFKSLVAAVHRSGMRIIIDLVANHTAWDSKWLMEHPDWFTKNSEGAIVAPNPDWTDVADLNYDSHEMRKEMIRMMRYWVDEIGIDGYRCDVAEMVPTDFWNIARSEIESKKPIMMLAEGTLPEQHVKAFDMTYAWNTYDILSRIIDGSTPVSIFDKVLQTERYQFPKGSLRLRFNTNHDKNAWEAPAVKKFSPEGAKATAVLMFTLPGVPLIYNGEEAGNPKVLGLFEKVDIDWNAGKDFRKLYTDLTELRKQHPALRRGSFASIRNSDGEKVYTFARQIEGDTVLVAVNLAKKARSISAALPSEYRACTRKVFGNATLRYSQDTLHLDLPPFGSAVVAK
jgi:glycosidase